MNKIPVVELVNVSKIYNESKEESQIVKALDQVSIKIMAGEYIAITGPSGSGKSTLMHMVGILDTPTEGKILIDGVDASKLDDNSLAKMRKSWWRWYWKLET